MKSRIFKIFCCLMILTAGESAHAHTYQFFFSDPAPQKNQTGSTSPAGKKKKAKTAIKIIKQNTKSTEASPAKTEPATVHSATDTVITIEQQTQQESSAASVLQGPNRLTQRWRLSPGFSFTHEYRDSFSLALNTAYHFSQTMALNIFINSHVGADFEYLPIQIGLGKNDAYFQMGPTAGLGNAGIHIGSRFLVRMDERFGFTNSIRANTSIFMIETGFVFYL